eukprot:124204-Chlamydomonas_euryale.AAC.2
MPGRCTGPQLGGQRHFLDLARTRSTNDPLMNRQLSMPRPSAATSPAPDNGNEDDVFGRQRMSAPASVPVELLLHPHTQLHASPPYMVAGAANPSPHAAMRYSPPGGAGLYLQTYQQPLGSMRDGSMASPLMAGSRPVHFVAASIPGQHHSIAMAQQYVHHTLMEGGHLVRASPTHFTLAQPPYLGNMHYGPSHARHGPGHGYVQMHTYDPASNAPHPQVSYIAHPPHHSSDASVMPVVHGQPVIKTEFMPQVLPAAHTAAGMPQSSQPAGVGAALMQWPSSQIPHTLAFVPILQQHPMAVQITPPQDHVPQHPQTHARPE